MSHTVRRHTGGCTPGSGLISAGPQTRSWGLGERGTATNPTHPDCGPGVTHFKPGKFDAMCDVMHFWSPHTGGAHFAFADGGVRFLRYSADEILPALATRAGGEPVPAGE